MIPVMDFSTAFGATATERITELEYLYENTEYIYKYPGMDNSSATVA